MAEIVFSGTTGEVVMVTVSGRTGRREILVVLAIACAGVLLALLAAFTPWYAIEWIEWSAVVDVTVPGETAATSAAGS